VSRKRRNGGGGGGRPAAHLGDTSSVNGRGGPDLRIVRGGENITIGEIGGESHGKVTATFGFFGRTLRVNPDLTELEVIDLLEEADNVKMTDIRSMTMTKKYARAHVHPDDFDEFWRLIKANNQGTADIMVTCWKILDGITANPTGGPSDSSGGQPATSPSSPPASSTPAGPPSDRRAAFLQHIERIQNRTDEDGNPLPVNAAIAAQLAVAAKAQGIDLDAGRPLEPATA
jgi:hypothetical protein